MEFVFSSFSDLVSRTQTLLSTAYARKDELTKKKLQQLFELEDSLIHLQRLARISELKKEIEASTPAADQADKTEPTVTSSSESEENYTLSASSNSSSDEIGCGDSQTSSSSHDSEDEEMSCSGSGSETHSAIDEDNSSYSLSDAYSASAEENSYSGSRSSDSNGYVSVSLAYEHLKSSSEIQGSLTSSFVEENNEEVIAADVVSDTDADLAQCAKMLTGWYLTLKTEIEDEYNTMYCKFMNLKVEDDVVYQLIDDTIGVSKDNVLDDEASKLARNAYEHFLNWNNISLSNADAIKDEELLAAVRIQQQLKPTVTRVEPQKPQLDLIKMKMVLKDQERLDYLKQHIQKNYGLDKKNVNKPLPFTVGAVMGHMLAIEIMKGKKLKKVYSEIKPEPKTLIRPATPEEQMPYTITDKQYKEVKVKEKDPVKVLTGWTGEYKEEDKEKVRSNWKGVKDDNSFTFFFNEVRPKLEKPHTLKHVETHVEQFDSARKNRVG